MQSWEVANVESDIRPRQGPGENQSNGTSLLEERLEDELAPRSKTSRSSTKPVAGSQSRERSFWYEESDPMAVQTLEEALSEPIGVPLLQSSRVEFQDIPVRLTCAADPTCTAAECG